MRWLFRTDYRSFYLLNATQFLGALNDNVFKLLVIYLLINVKGPAAANSILSLAGAIFVIPFLIFSSGAGILADRISKRTIIVFTKFLELLIMLFGLTAIIFKWEIGAYSALFLMATQSAIFGPSKYGIIVELVEPKMVSKANGSMTSFTYLAIILGTFLASFITDITNKNFVIEASVCVFIAVLGLLTSFGIRRTAPQNSPKKLNPLFLYEIYQTIKFSWSIPHLLPAIYGSSFFLFVGAFSQLNIIPFAMQSLDLSEVGGGYLFLSTAVGIAIGAVLAGQLSKDRIEPGISCICGFFMVIFFFILYFFATSLIITIITLGLLGIFGGAYLIPFDAFLQVNSPDEKRGQVIAAANFFSFVGVLMASFCLYIISEELGFSAASGFALMGALTLISNIVITGRLSALFFPFFVQKILKKFRKLKITTPIPDPSQVVILQSSSWWDAILLFSCFPKLKILVPSRPFRRFPWVNGLVDSIRIVPLEPDRSTTIQNLWGSTKRLQGQNCSACLFLRKQPNSEQIIKEFLEVMAALKTELVPLRREKSLFAWADELEKLTERFLLLDFSNEADMEAENVLKGKLRDFRRAARQIDGNFPPSFIQSLLEQPSSVDSCASHLHAVRIHSMDLSFVPTKALFLIGMDEESFPEIRPSSSLDLLKKEKIGTLEPVDRDRYLFLQALFAPSRFLSFSYGHLSPDEGKPVGPSLLIQELLTYLDTYFSLKSEELTVAHPPLSFDPRGGSGHSVHLPQNWNLGCLPELRLPLEETTLSFGALSSLTRHPWKFYLQKVQGIYLQEPAKESWEESFALQKSRLLRTFFDRPVGREISFRRDALPDGLFGEAYAQELKEKAAEWQAELAGWGVKEIFSVIFQESCQTNRWEAGNFIVPPLEICLENQVRVRLIGEIKNVSLQGLICSGDDSIGGVLKIWPEALAVAIVLSQPNILMLKSGKIRKLENPETDLGRFLEYYFRCGLAPSPLLVDWADSILRKGPIELEKKMKTTLSGRDPFTDPVVQWVLARSEMPTAQELLQGWGDCLKESFAGLRALYPTRARKGEEIHAAL